MVVYAIPSILLFGAEWTKWATWRSGQSLGKNKMANQSNTVSATNLNSFAEPEEKTVVSFQSIFGTMAIFFLFHIQ